MYGYIYIVTNNLNNKKYIGKKRGDPDKTRSYLGSGTYLNNAFNKYGKDNFSKEVIDYAQDLKTLNDKEKFWISVFDASNSEEFYNISKGGDGYDWTGLRHSDESKRLIGEKNKARWNSLSDEEKEAYSQKQSELTAGKRNGMFGKIHPNRGKSIHTDEFKAKQSNRQKGNQNGKLSAKKYTVIDPTGVSYDVDNMNEFCEDRKLNATKMREVARGGRSHHQKWKAFPR